MVKSFWFCVRKLAKKAVAAHEAIQEIASGFDIAVSEYPDNVF